MLNAVVSANKLLHPKYCVIIPPRLGPSELPRYTPAALMPRAFPRSRGGNIATNIADAVQNIIELAVPCNIRAAIRNFPEHARPHKIVVKVKSRAPEINIFFLPIMSANLPIGINNTAVERRYAVIIQLREVMVMPNSFPMAGKERSIARPIKEGKKLQSPNIKRSLNLLATIEISSFEFKMICMM